VSFVKKKVTESLVLKSEIQNLKPRHAFIRLRGYDLVKTDISCRRRFLEESENNRKGVQTTSAFEMRPGLSLEEIYNDQALYQYNARMAYRGSPVDISSTGGGPQAENENLPDQINLATYNKDLDIESSGV